jgi:hypothetical protein
MFGIRKTYHSSRRNLLSYLFINRAMKLTAVVINEYHCYEPCAKSYPTFSQG